MRAGSHPVRDLFKSAKQLDLSGEVPRRGSNIKSDTPDLCDSALTASTTLTTRAAPPYGAFADFNRCRRATPSSFKHASGPPFKINLE